MKFLAPLCFLALLCAAPLNQARADSIAASCTAHAPAGLLVQAFEDDKTHLCTGFVIKRKGRKLAEVRNGFMGSGAILVSADGLRAVFIHSTFYGRLRGDGQLVAYGLHFEKIPVVNDGLIFFYKGKRTASYTLEELLHRPNLVHVSVSHVNWLSDSSGIFREPLGDNLTIETSSFRRYRFDTKTGAMLSSKDIAPWTTCSHMVYGEVQLDGQAKMDPAYAMKGDVPDHFRFQIPPGLKISAGYTGLCLREEGAQWWADQLIPSFNGVAIAPKAGDERRFRCSQDADCTVLCSGGAVNRSWYEVNRASLSPCDDGCASKGLTSRCHRRSCVTMERGKLHRQCSRKR